MEADTVADATDSTRLPLMGDRATSISQHPPIDSDTRSDASFDPLFDDVPEESLPTPSHSETKLAMPGSSNSQQPQTTSRGISTTIPPPKGAPPLFDSANYANLSPELLMTSFIDGQVILWDRRAQSHGQGVGRLWMSEKTPPWCLSVRSNLLYFPCCQMRRLLNFRHVGQPMAAKFTQEGGMALSMCGMSVCLDSRGLPIHPDC